MQYLHARFVVGVSTEDCSFRGQSGEAELRMQLPRSVLQGISAGDLFTDILKAALVNLDTAVAEEEVEEEGGK